MTTILVDGNYVVGATQNLTFTATSSGPIYTLDGQSSTGDPTFTDNGTIQISSSLANVSVSAFGDNGYAFYFNSLIEISTNATLGVSATGAGSSAYGYSSGTWPAAVENDGTFTVSAVQTAVGASLYLPSETTRPGFNNTGLFQVSAANATGVWSGYPGQFLNSGTLTVTGTTSAVGIAMGYFEGGSVTNSGTITVTASSGKAYGITVGGLDEVLNITNTGTITAQHAIYEANSSSPAQTPVLHLANSGAINGDIVLGQGPGIWTGGPGQSAGAQIHNTGEINGAIHLDANGNDLYDGRGGTQTGGIYLGDGTDTVYLGDDGETVHGGAGAALLTGGTGADTFIGGAGADLVDGGGGDDALDGGAGTNTVSFASAATGVTVSLASQGSAQTTGVGSVTLANFQNLIGSAHADVLTGDAHDNLIDGGGGDDVIDGGDGANTISFASATAGVTVSLASQGSAQTTGAGSVTLSHFQNLTGSAYADHLTGDGADNVIDGGAGGDDVLDGGGGTDTLSFASESAGVAFSLAVQGNAQNTGVGAVTATGFQNLVGSAYADHLAGDANDNVIDGGGGNDVLDGAGGTNTVSFASAATGVTVSLALQGQAQTTGVGSLTLSNFQNLTGSAFDDILQNGAGNNVLAGGAGADTFVIAPNGGADTVSDFSDAQGDKIDLTHFYRFTDFSQVLALATQSNADAVIDFGGGSTLTLKNVAVGDLTAADFVLTAAPITVGSGTIATDAALRLSATSGSLVYFSGIDVGTLINNGALTLTGGYGVKGVASYAYGNPGATFENDGVFSVSGYGPLGVDQVTTHNSGTFTVTGTMANQTAQGVIGDAVNSGTMTIQSAGSAFGVTDTNSSPYGVFQNLAAGDFSVTSSTGRAIGVNLYYGHDFENAGQFTVSAVTSAMGLTYGADYWSTNTIINSGTITVSGATSIGISVSSSYGVASVSIENTGTITAQVALSYSETGANITNGGTLDGAVQLANYANSIVNTGTITGAVGLGNGSGDTLDSHAGTIGGLVTLGTGSSTVTLGSENNTVALAAGTHVVDGGGGTNTVSYGNAASAVHVSLAAQGQAQNTGVGTDTLAHVQALVGSSHDDTLEGGGAAPSTLTGGLGADTFAYRPGDGAVTVTDFSPVQGDRIDLSGVASLPLSSAALAASSQVGADTVIAIDGGSLTLKNVSLAGLTQSDFVVAGPTVGPGVGGTPQIGPTAGGTITGGSGSDWLQGQGGNDTLQGGAGSDYLDGGGGQNTAVYSGVYRQYTVSPGQGEVGGGPEGGTDVLANIERIQFVDGYLATSPTDTAGQVYRVYEATLGRAPDQAGLTNWVHQLNGGASLQGVVDGFVGSTEFQNDYGQVSDSQFVTLLYQNVLHRSPDQAGLDNWVGMLASGQDTRAQVVTGFSESQEDVNDLAPSVQQGLWVADAAAGEVARLYDTMFSRLPDASGLANWTHSLETGASLQSVADGFVGSAEFQAVYGALDDSHFITLLYHNVLHREPDTPGLLNWFNALASGQDTRAQVVVGFSESPEHIANLAPHIDSGIWVAS